MCLTIPGKIIKIDGNIASVKRYDGIKEVNISTTPGVKKGDWLLATVGLAVKKINEKDAKEIIDLLESHRLIREDKLSKKFKEIILNSKKGELKKDEIEYLLSLDNKDEIESLFSEADVVRKTSLKDFICLHGIIEFSNYCGNNCLYCGVRAENRNLTRFRMSPEEVVATADEAVNKKGYKMLVLQSGMDLGYRDEEIERIVKGIKERCRVFVFLSVGERSPEAYEKFKKAGADGVLFRFETTNPSLYEKYHPGGVNKGNKENRFELLKKMKEMGYYIASGPLIGLPGQTISDLANDIIFMKDFKVNMVSMGPFIPSKETPLKDEEKGDMEMALKMIAVSRLVMPRSRIVVASSLETLDKEGRKKGLQSGGNSIMFNLTPAKYREDYKIYPGKKSLPEESWEKYALFSGEEDSYQMIEDEIRSGLSAR
ncbi:MAG: [FeFe] hydrogenase H-cluster radical SAM maturase HydE [Parcubacteria group bacterium]|nr:[FeFe] hydrogenase H-cluster radical SAM maturase HydE [Parcubacteria group bacterium]MCR4342941.1 [FeFe] hydrogenase H-cluster radical SAM maturase HydE [Patescibacteria group bacterium]